jgi:hypothetical protein
VIAILNTKLLIYAMQPVEIFLAQIIGVGLEGQEQLEIPYIVVGMEGH